MKIQVLTLDKVQLKTYNTLYFKLQIKNVNKVKYK